MRKLLPALLLCGTLLPGCVLAIGNGDDGDKARHRLDNLEHRLSMLEQHLGHDGPSMNDDREDDEHEGYQGHEEDEEHEGPEGQPMHH